MGDDWGRDRSLWGSSELTAEADTLADELQDWLVEKLLDGYRPIPLQAALLAISRLAGGHGKGAQEFLDEVRKARPLPAPPKEGT